MNRSEVYRAINSERAYQQAQGLPDERTKLEWMRSINHYCNMAWSDTHAMFPEHVRKIAALAVAALEQHDCTPREGYEQPARPVVVCLCGSTRFWREFQRASLAETIAGKIVLSIGAASGTDDEHFGNLPREEYDHVKAMLDELHLRKIEMADEVLILNIGDYIGESTARELAYARKLGKTVRFLEPER